MIKNILNHKYVVLVMIILNILLLLKINNQNRLNKERISVGQKESHHFQKESEVFKSTIQNLKESLEINGNLLNDVLLENCIGEKTTLFSLISDTTIFYINTKNSCKSCLYEELEEIKSFSERSCYKVICLSFFEKSREFKAYIHSNELEQLNFFNAYNSVLLEGSISKAHLLFITDSSHIVKKSFVLDKIHPELNNWFAGHILNKFRHNCKEIHITQHSH